MQILLSCPHTFLIEEVEGNNNYCKKYSQENSSWVIMALIRMISD